jgi:hypothetical protein
MRSTGNRARDAGKVLHSRAVPFSWQHLPERPMSTKSNGTNDRSGFDDLDDAFFNGAVKAAAQNSEGKDPVRSP